MTIDTTNMCSHLQRKLFPDLKRGVLSEDGIWNLLSDYREKQKKQ